MEKKSGKKPAAEPAPKTFPPSIIREEGKFLVAGKEETYTITVFDAHGKDEGPIDSGMMILRGSADQKSKQACLQGMAPSCSSTEMIFLLNMKNILSSFRWERMINLFNCLAGSLTNGGAYSSGQR